MNNESIYNIKFEYPSRWSPFEYLLNSSIQDYMQIQIPSPYIGYVVHDNRLLTLVAGTYNVGDIIADQTRTKGYHPAGICIYNPKKTMSGHLGFMYMELPDVESGKKVFLESWGDLEIKFINPAIFLSSIYERWQDFSAAGSFAREYIAAIVKLAVQPMAGEIIRQGSSLKQELASHFQEKCCPHLSDTFNKYGIELLKWNINSLTLTDFADRSRQNDATPPNHRIEPVACSPNDNPLLVMCGEYSTYKDIWFG